MDNNKITADTSPKNYTLLPLKPKNITESSKIMSAISPNSNEIIDTGKPLAFLRKKREYRQFLKLIKSKKTIPATILAQTLGVNIITIREWLNTPRALEVLASDINYHLNYISKSKDWKAHAWVIDRISPQDKTTTNIQVNTLDGLTIIRR
jgi:hypothetical protein